MIAINLIEKAFSKNDFERVIKLCDKIPQNQTALSYKARSLCFLDRPQEALEILDSAGSPDNPYHQYIRAEALMNMSQYDRAIECFERIFELGVDDETSLAFMKLDYGICLSLRQDQLIEKEKYVDAWKCYNRKLDFESDNLKRSEAIKRFIRHIKNSTSKVKSRRYHVMISSDGAKVKLMEFLEENGFKSGNCDGLLFLIDVVGKTYSADDAAGESIISESKFYDKVNHYPRGKVHRKAIFDEAENLVYEGYVLNDMAYGFGKAYFENGNIYREGIFDIKGIAQGKEYYPSGQLRFEGEWSITRGYGPNAPFKGNAYSEDGKLIYSGQFEIRRGGSGWPKIQKPKGFPIEQNEKPKINYYTGVIE